MDIDVTDDSISPTARAVTFSQLDGDITAVQERMAVNPHLIPSENAWGPWSQVIVEPQLRVGEWYKVFDPPHPIVVQWRDTAGANAGVPYRGIAFPAGAVLPGETVLGIHYNDDGVSIGNQLYGSLPAGAVVNFRVTEYPDAGSGTIMWSVFRTPSTPPQVALGTINPNTGLYRAPTAEQVLYQRIPIGVRITFQEIFPPARALTDEVSFVLDIPKPASREGFVDMGARLPDAPYRFNFTAPNLPLLTGLTGRARDPDQTAFSDVRTIFLRSFRYGLTGLRDAGAGDIQMRLAHSPSGAATDLIIDRADDLGWAIQANSDLSIVARWQFGPEQAGFTDSTVDPDNPTAANFINTDLADAFAEFTQYLFTNPNGHVLLLWDPAGLPEPLPNPRTGRAIIGSPTQFTSNGFQWNRNTAPVNIGRAAVNGAFRRLQQLRLRAVTNRTNNTNLVNINLLGDPDLASNNADVEDEANFGFRITEIGERSGTFAWQIGGDANGSDPYTLRNQDNNYISVQDHALLRTFLEGVSTQNEYVLSWSKDGIPPLEPDGKPAWTESAQINRLWTADKEVARLWDATQLIFERGTLP